MHRYRDSDEAENECATPCWSHKRSSPQEIRLGISLSKQTLSHCRPADPIGSDLLIHVHRMSTSRVDRCLFSTEKIATSSLNSPTKNHLRCTSIHMAFPQEHAVL